jgi:hypothetical protein
MQIVYRQAFSAGTRKMEKASDLLNGVKDSYPVG